MRSFHISISRSVANRLSQLSYAAFVALTILAGGCQSVGSSSSLANSNQGGVVTAAERAAFASGVEAYGRGAFAAAVAQFKIAAAGEPPPNTALLNLAVAQQAAGDVDGALQTLQRPLAAPSCDVDIARGLLQRRVGKLTAAEQSYKGCLAHEPNNVVAWRNLGVLYELYLSKPQAALAAYKQVQAAPASATGPDAEVAAWIATLEGGPVASSAP